MSDPKLPDYLLERLAQGDLEGEAARRAQERLDREPGGAARLAALRASDAALLARHPPQAVAAEVARRRRRAGAPVPGTLPARPRWLGWVLAPAGVLAAALLLVTLRPEQTQVKGDAALLVYGNRGGRADLLTAGASARAGEVVQLGYIRARPVYGAIVSLDGGGKETLHLPDEGADSVRLTADARTLLPHAYELDAAPHYERFFLVTSERPFSASVALGAARKLFKDGAGMTGPLPLPQNFSQSSFLLLKAGP